MCVVAGMPALPEECKHRASSDAPWSLMFGEPSANADVAFTWRG